MRKGALSPGIVIKMELIYALREERLGEICQTLVE